jgi:uncharacterized protein
MALAENPADNLIAAMAKPDFYPQRPDVVEFKQTHISCVFLAGEFVYKVKKPICFPFVDYSTLERRYHFCQEEVRLNRRLTSRVYLGVFPIYRHGQRFKLGAQAIQQFDPRAAEYAVRMRRLPDERSLERLARTKHAGSEEMRRIARVLADFHAGAARERAALYGSPETIAQAIGVNLEECEPFIDDTLSRRQFDLIDRFNRNFVTTHRELMERRLREGMVREGHGDLRAEHIYIDDHIDIVDCVEFSEGFRYADVASDLAFLLMDLDRLGAPAAGHQLLTAYLQATGDSQLPKLLNFYKCHRAVVRGKVASIKARGAEVPDAQQRAARATARNYFASARGYAKAGSPSLIVVCGLPATGKSTIALALAERSGFELFNSDVIRKRLAGRAPADRAAADYGAGIYSRELTAATYQALLDEASRALRAGNGAIIDATFKDVAERERLRDLARRMGAPIAFAECVLVAEQARRRLAERAARPDAVSDANWDIYKHYKAEFTTFGRDFADCHLTVNGAVEPAEAACEIERFIANHC